MNELKELLLGIGIWSIIIIVIFMVNKHNEKIEEERKKNPPPELTEEEKAKQEDIDNKIGFLLIFSFGLALGGFACYHIYNNTDWINFWDLEKKKYIPVVVGNNLYMINQKNGKTYKLEKFETSNSYFYEYRYLTVPKNKRIKLYSKKDPLNIIKDIDSNKLDNELTKRKLIIKH